MSARKNSPLRRIRAYCLKCCGSSCEVSLCPVPDCPLYDFRFGKNPFRAKRELTEEQIEAVRQRLAEARRRNATKKSAENADKNKG